MYPAPFEYTRPETYDEAVSLLTHHGEGAKVIAGGQSLVPMMHLRFARPDLLIDIAGLDRTRAPRVADGWLHIPAQARQRVIERLPTVGRAAPLVATAAAHTGNIRVRSRGTIGGNLAHADPSSEISCAVVALGGSVDIIGPEGARSVAATDFFVSDFTTVLEPTELISSIRVPAISESTGHGFAEFARRAGEFAVVNAAAVVTLGADGRCTAAAIACGGVGARILDGTSAATDLLVGHTPTPERISATAAEVAALSRPRDDHQASASYRRKMVEVFTRRALGSAATDAGSTAGG